MSKTLNQKNTEKTKKVNAPKAEKKELAMAAPKEQKATPTKSTKKETSVEKTLEQLQKDVVMKKMELMMGKLKDVRSISRTNDEIARLKTAARMKELTNENL